MFWLFLFFLVACIFLIETAVFFIWTKILGFKDVRIKTILLYSILILIWNVIMIAIPELPPYQGLFVLLNIAGIFAISYLIFKDKTEKKLHIYIFPILSILSATFVAFLFIAVIRAALFTPFYIQGNAMEPNFKDKEYLIIKKFDSNINRGDVIIFNHFDDKTQQTYKIIKRVIGLPNEHVILKDGEITIDDFVLTEQKSDYYYTGMTTSGTIDIVLGSDEYFVLGDNRDESFDSRSFGPIKKEAIVGEYWMKQTDLLNKLKKTQK